LERVAGFPPRAFFVGGVSIKRLGGFLVSLGVIAVAGACAAAGATAAAPQVRQTWVEDVKPTSAELHAQLDAGGLATTYRFEYVTDAGYQANVRAGKDGFLGAARIPVGEKSAGKGSDSPVSETPKDLRQETTYWYRVVAKNEGGTALGSARTLTTKGTAGPQGPLDGRGWEMVSPVDKNGGEIPGPGGVAGGGVFQAGSQGGAVTFSSASSFGPGAGGAPEGNQYISRRGAGGWAVENITAPLVAGGYGEALDGVPYQLFSPELSLGLMLAPDGPPLPGSAAPAGYRNYYLRDAADGYAALLTEADVASLAVPPQSFELSFAGASPDLGHVLLSTCAALTPNATEAPGPGEGCDPKALNLYARSASGWRLINVRPGDSSGTAPARLAASSGAVSSDGSRVYWTDGADLYLSEVGADAVQADEAAGGGGTFQAASADGSVAFFTRLGSLYRYDVVTGATVNLTPGAGVIGVFGASADGATVYYATTAGLFVDRDGSSAGPFAASADPTNFPPSTGTARVSADGRHLAFVSSAELTPYDNTGPGGEPVAEIYLYEAGAKQPTCISCNPTGERPDGPSTLLGAPANGQGVGATRAYKPRVLSADGNRLFFDTGETLTSGDTNHVRRDVYEWEAAGSGSCARPPGCLQLISAGSSFDSFLVDASASGDDVFFLTDNSLVKSDPGSADLYDARVGGGFPEPQPPFVCEEDACQPLPSAPDDPAPGTLVPNPGNPPVHFPKKHKKKKKHQKKHSGRKGSRR
jgi:hypothetical protein